MKKFSPFCVLIFLISLVIFFSVVFIFASNFVFAATFQQVTLLEGENAKVAGKTILLEAAYSDLIIVQVDGYKKTIKTFAAEDEGGFIVYTSHTTYVGGINITVVDVFESQGKATLNVSVAFDCGDGTCEANENKKICCEDCGCSAGYSCVDNQCIESVLNECFSDEDCNDSNSCTIEACAGIPRKCSYARIDYCKDYDNCCPEICMYENDSDCPENKTMYECFTYRDCKKQGQSPCNLSVCEVGGKCAYEIQEGCSFNNSCMAINSTALINETSFICTLEDWIELETEKKIIREKGKTEFKKYLWLFILFAVLIIIIIFLAYKSFFRKKPL